MTEELKSISAKCIVDRRKFHIGNKMTKQFNYTFNNEEKKIIKSYSDEMTRDLKALKNGLAKNDFPLIRHSAHGLELNAGWIVTLINDSLEKQINKVAK